MDYRDTLYALTMCAKLYDKNLSNRSVLFVYGDFNNVKQIECVFKPNNYYHLSGVVSSLPPVLFYERCLNNRLTYKDFAPDLYGCYELKLSVLPQLMEIHKRAKMVSDFADNHIALQTDKLVGSVTAVLGFKNVHGTYFPNTSMKSDIRDESQGKAERLLCAYRKRISDKSYSEICYVANGVKETIIRSQMQDRGYQFHIEQ